MAFPLKSTRVVWLLAYLIPFASSSGCFLGSMEISLADGKRKKLQDVELGDPLASFDEVIGKPSVSYVMAIPKFRREYADLVEIMLPSARIHATHDHPFWSRGRKSLVSAHPNMTMEYYSFQVDAINNDEELEDEQQQGVGVSSVLRAPARSLAASSLQGSTGDVEVMTLCMHPHHWYYVHGVRVHNKGCFVPSTPVSLADGTKKELRHVAIGDRVSSWDDVLGIPVNSTVVARPTFQRRISELVEVSLPLASIHVTHDHPFWSKGRRGLVSFNPYQTQEEYDLEASLMVVGEELDSPHDQHAPVIGLRRLGANVQTTDQDEHVDVMTLCLQPHHWYYVHGVRVHNKGCFAPWTPVLMSDYTQKPISEVKENEKVISWDESKGHTSVATVIGIASFPAGKLLEINLNITTGETSADNSVARRLRYTAMAPQHAGAHQLIMTHDHPVYSARTGAMVSMSPSQSSEYYGLTVGQMHEYELLRHHYGLDVHALVQNWSGHIEYVMTLRLDRHHWFHVHGVRVHNKGGSGGVSGGGGEGGSSDVSYSRSSYHGSYMGLILLSSGARRRYGTYLNDEDSKCSMVRDSQARLYCCSSGLGDCDASSGVEYSATAQENCYECMDCQTEDCINSKPNCEDFLGNVFQACRKEEEETNVVAIVIFVIAVIMGNVAAGITAGSWLFYRRRKSKFIHAQLEEMKERREAMQACNFPNYRQLFFIGTCTEKGETKPTKTTIDLTETGRFTGETKADDCHFQYEGTLNWQPGDHQGEIAWRQTWRSLKIEYYGTIVPDCGGGLKLDANYFSTNSGTRGYVSMTCAGAAGSCAPAVMETVVPWAAPLLLGQQHGVNPASKNM